MVWCVSGPGIYGKLQRLVCRCTVRQTTNVAEDGVTTSGYSTEYAWQIRAVGYSPVADEVIPNDPLRPNFTTVQHITRLVQWHGHLTCKPKKSKYSVKCTKRL